MNHFVVLALGRKVGIGFGSDLKPTLPVQHVLENRSCPDCVAKFEACTWADRLHVHVSKFAHNSSCCQHRPSQIRQSLANMRFWKKDSDSGGATGGDKYAVNMSESSVA